MPSPRRTRLLPLLLLALLSSASPRCAASWNPQDGLPVGVGALSRPYALLGAPRQCPDTGHWFAVARQSTGSIGAISGTFQPRRASDMEWRTLEANVPGFVLSARDAPAGFDLGAVPYLATITTRAEHAFILENWPGVNMFIGATDNDEMPRRPAGNSSSWAWTATSPEGSSVVAVPVGFGEAWDGWGAGPLQPPNDEPVNSESYARIDCGHGGRWRAKSFRAQAFALIEWGSSIVAPNATGPRMLPTWAGTPQNQSCFGGNRYEVVDNLVTNWYSARDIAIQQGGHLLVVTSNAELLFTMSLLSMTPFGNFYIGASDELATGIYTVNVSAPEDGSIVYNTSSQSGIFSVWNPYEPNGSQEKHVEMTACFGWNDIDGQTVNRGFVIEYEKDEKCTQPTTGMLTTGDPSSTLLLATSAVTISSSSSVGTSGLTGSGAKSSDTGSSEGEIVLVLVIVFVLAALCISVVIGLALFYVLRKRAADTESVAVELSASDIRSAHAGGDRRPEGSIEGIYHNTSSLSSTKEGTYHNTGLISNKETYHNVGTMLKDHVVGAYHNVGKVARKEDSLAVGTYHNVKSVEDLVEEGDAMRQS